MPPPCPPLHWLIIPAITCPKPTAYIPPPAPLVSELQLYILPIFTFEEDEYIRNSQPEGLQTVPNGPRHSLGPLWVI